LSRKRSACIPADNHDAASLHARKVAPNAAACSCVGSTRTLTTCFTLPTLATGTDIARRPHALPVPIATLHPAPHTKPELDVRD